MPPISYARNQFPPVVIQHAACLHLRFTLAERVRALVAGGPLQGIRPVTAAYRG